MCDVLLHDDLLSLIFLRLSAPTRGVVTATCKTWHTVSVAVSLRCAERWVYRPKAAYLPADDSTQGVHPTFDPANYSACVRRPYRPTEMGRGLVPSVPLLDASPRPAVASMPLSPDSQHQATRWQRVMGALMLSPDSFAYSIRARMGWQRSPRTPRTPRSRTPRTPRTPTPRTPTSRQSAGLR